MIIESLGLCYHLGCFKVRAGFRSATEHIGRRSSKTNLIASGSLVCFTNLVNPGECQSPDPFIEKKKLNPARSTIPFAFYQQSNLVVVVSSGSCSDLYLKVNPLCQPSSLDSHPSPLNHGLDLSVLITPPLVTFTDSFLNSSPSQTFSVHRL